MKICLGLNEAKHVYKRNMFYSFQAKHVSLISSETCKTVLSETCNVHLSEICLNLSERNMYRCPKNLYAAVLVFYQEGVEGVNFTDVLDDDTTLVFSLSLDTKREYRLSRVDLGRSCLPDLSQEGEEIKTRKYAISLIHQGKDYEEYGLSIPETMLTEAIKQSESYQTFIKYATGQIPPKKSRDKGLQRKKTTNDSQETVDVSEESEPECEPVKRKTSSERRVKKKVTLSSDDNIISDDLDTALEIVTESIPEHTKRRKSGKVTSDPLKKLKGVPSLTPEEQEVTDIMQALKESKRQPGTRGSSEGTGTILGVPDESTVVSTTSSEGTGTKLGVPDEEKDITKENVILKWGSEQESEYSEEDKLDDEEKDDKEGDANEEDDETKSDEDDIYMYKIHVRKDDDEEMINAEVEDSDKGDKEVTDAAKADVEKTSKVKDDPKKTKLPLISSSLSVSSGFGDQFLKLSSDSSLVSTIKDTTDEEINSFLDVKIQSKVQHTHYCNNSTSFIYLHTPYVHQQTTIAIPTPIITTDAPIITTAVFESDALSSVQLGVAKLEKDVSDLKKIYLSAEALTALETQVPSVVDNYLGSKVRDVFQNELKKHTGDLIQKYYL
nr:hypothetical protein [Tanacetum cinerariifolium]